MTLAQEIQEDAYREYNKLFRQGDDIGDDFKCADFYSLELPFWFSCLTCMCTYMAIINYISVGHKILTKRFNFSSVEAGYYYCMPYLIAAIFCPILGKIVEEYGKRMTMTIAGSCFMVLAHLINAMIDDTCDRCWISLVPMVLLGLSYTTYAVILWGSLPYMVEARVLGTAFGICTTF